MFAVWSDKIVSFSFFPPFCTSNRNWKKIQKYSIKVDVERTQMWRRINSTALKMWTLNILDLFCMIFFKKPKISFSFPRQLYQAANQILEKFLNEIRFWVAKYYDVCYIFLILLEDETIYSSSSNRDWSWMSSILLFKSFFFSIIWSKKPSDSAENFNWS